MVTTFTVPTHSPKKRRIRAVFGYFVRPSVVTDTILGEPGDKLKDDVIFVEFEKMLFETTGLDESRFIAFEVGRHAGFCIILNSNMVSIPPASPEVAEKVKEYLAFLGDRLVGPKWFRWRL
ncbi:hypothetical protein BJV78DRAFT_860698 [Lactifluus subvellereus]|nr:hypothetical protein BJV78DRAFT_860698 [Lactifluus subvellereus]